MRYLVFVAGFCAAFLQLAIFGAAAWAEERIALVIGNSAYTNTSPLKNPANDAQLISESLRSVGFTVFEYHDLDQKDMKRAVLEFGDLLVSKGPDTVGLFYYSGHGIQANGTNYLLPVDATVKREKDVDIESVRAESVLHAMEEAGNRLNIVVLDACRNNPFEASYRAVNQGLARMDAPSGTLIAYSTSPGRVATDGEGRNSPYTFALARAMRTPGLSVEEAFKQVRVRVMERTSNEQVPWESSSLTGAFSFAGGIDGQPERVELAALPPAGAQSTGNAVNDEVVFWQSIQASDNASDFQAYLDAYGEEGIFGTLAKNRIFELKKPGAAKAVQSRALMTDDEAARAAIEKAQKMMAEMRENSAALLGKKDQPLAEKLEKFRGMLGFIVDFDVMSRFVVGKYREQMTPEQYEDYQALYRELFLSVYDFTSGETWAGGFEIEQVRPYGGDYLVKLRLGKPGPDQKKVGLRIRRKDNSFFGFVIIDALVANVSILKTQHDDFQAILARQGVDGLIAKLTELAGPVEAPLAIPN
ncbi:caspase family protein [Hwanghaeella sp.]|uniref:caspase family protein n=1 Tax=Hwanghaeella sp. TaxID=2605943 RepID=UPI003CCBD9F1